MAAAAVNPVLEREGLEETSLACCCSREAAPRPVQRGAGQRPPPWRWLYSRRFCDLLVDIHGQTTICRSMREREHVHLLDRYVDLLAPCQQAGGRGAPPAGCAQGVGQPAP